MGNGGFQHIDELGPWKTIEVYEPSSGLKGVLVIDNVAAGPAIGGLRMAVDVSTEECTRLARAMTLKNAAAGLRHGGAKSVLYGDPRMPKADKERFVRAFASSLQDERSYIFGPDMGTNEECMAWVHDEIGRASGLPREIGGIPLDEIGATGWGCRHAAEIATEFSDVELEGARVVVQGFGAVGIHAARFLAQKGTILVGAADSRGSVYDSNGLDVDLLVELKENGAGVTDYPHGEKHERNAVVGYECDIWIPAARPDVINEQNVDQLRARIVIQGANIPLTDEAENILHKKGVINIPDFIANSGGVICAAMEYAGASEGAVFDVIADKTRNNTRQILEISRRHNIRPRDAGLQLARQRVEKAMSLRRWSVF